MKPIATIVFFLVGLTTLPSTMQQSLQSKYGQPIAETYRVRSGIVAAVQYGTSGEACSIIIQPEHAHSPLSNPQNSIGTYAQGKELLLELVPKNERGKFIIGGFVNLFCPDENRDCSGSSESWEKVGIFYSGGDDIQHYEKLYWKRDECQNDK
jgi:hypothetical protein